MPTVAAEPLREYVSRIFAAAGAPEADAALVAEHLVEANLKGHDSHGVIRTETYVTGIRNGVIVPNAPVEVERETETTAVVDGNWNFGQVVARRTTEIAIAKARSRGVGVAVARQSAHVGRVGAYGEMAAREGMVGIACVNNHGGGRLVAAFGGAERRLSTNPLVVAVPTGDPDAPWVMDFATSVGAEGKVRVARNKGAVLPPEWLLDGEGRPTTDPWDLYGGNPAGSKTPGALLPVGGPVGYKGFALSMAVEALAGALSGAGTSRPEATRGGNALFVMAIDIAPFRPLDDFSASFAGLIDFVKTPPFQEGVDEVVVAGEPERRQMAERLAHGIPLDGETWRQLCDCAASVGLPPLEA